MPVYRFYFLGSDGRIAGPPEIVECPDDAAAIKAAKALVDEKAMEVWEGSRIVIKVLPKE